VSRTVAAARAGRAAWALAGLLAAACAGPGFEYADLPTAEIALVHRTREESERVLELTRRLEEKRQPKLPGQVNMIRLEEVGEVFGLGRNAEERAADLLGRLAFVEPRTHEVRFASFATRGARPLDWSADHRRLLYQTFERSTAQVFEYDLERDQIRRITHSSQDHLGASYGPEGRIAFAEETPNDGYRIFVREPGGGEPRPITPGPWDLMPVWSPRGDWIAFQTQDPSGKEALAVVDAAGEAAPRLLARGRGPCFTPDGEWIVYSASTREGWRLWRMRVDGSGRRPLGGGPNDENDPAVSPDGRFVVFVSTQDQRQRLVVRSMDGTGDRPLLLDGDAIRPIW